MKSYMNHGIRLAAMLTSSLTFAVAGLFVATPAFADYGANPSYNYLSSACTSRYDANCITKEWNYYDETQVQPVQYNYPAYQQQYYQYPSYSYVAPSAPALPYTNYGSSYYQVPAYNYNYSYNTPTYEYETAPATTYYEYNASQYSNNYQYSNEYSNGYNYCYGSYNCSYQN